MSEHKSINISGGKSTPKIILDKEKNKFLIEGHSYPENASSFFMPIIEWFRDYLAGDDVDLTLDIKLLYINTSSTKAMFYIFDLLEEAYHKGKKIQINWLYNKDNEMSKETGEELLEDFSLPYSIIEI